MKFIVGLLFILTRFGYMPIKDLIHDLIFSDLDSRQRCFQHTRTQRKDPGFVVVAAAVVLLAVADMLAAVGM